MTTEEKARAYDEALKLAKEKKEIASRNGADITVKFLEEIFPELRESEDERIRKELKEAFEAYDIESKWNGIPIRSIFAWLEKQKEQKPAEIAPNQFDGITYGMQGYSTDKPAEWSEEDEETSKRIIADLRWGRRNTVSDKDIRQYDEEINWMENRLKSLRPHWKPGEEQMEALNYAIAEWDGGKRLEGLYALRDDLKKLM